MVHANEIYLEVTARAKVRDYMLFNCIAPDLLMYSCRISDLKPVKRRRIQLDEAPPPSVAEEAFKKKHMRPDDSEPLHCRDKTAPDHPIEGRNLEAGEKICSDIVQLYCNAVFLKCAVFLDKCVLNMQLLRDYREDIHKENRDFFINSCMAKSQKIVF